MSIILREAKRKRMIPAVPEFERLTRRSKRQDPLVDEDLELLFPVETSALERVWRIEDPRDGADLGLMFGTMFALCVSAGLRSGEIRAIHREQVVRKQLASGTELVGLIVDRAYDAAMDLGRLKKATGKDPRYRVVILPDRTVKILDAWLERAPQGDPLFQFRGEPITREHLLARWESGLARAGIDLAGRRITVHGLRYTYNSRMRPLLSAEVLQEFVGHRSDEMTELYDRPQLEARLLQLADQSGAVNRFWG
jgi:integrase